MRNSTTAPTKASSLTNADVAPPQMSGEEFFQRYHWYQTATSNKALRYFNRMSADFKFVVLTLANRNAPGTFQAKEIGEPFEYFDEARRLLIIKSMNEIARWGQILPRWISEYETKLPE